MGKTLNLTLKKKWFDMIASGEKKEEYREIKKYWVFFANTSQYLQFKGYDVPKYYPVSVSPLKEEKTKPLPVNCISQFGPCPYVGCCENCKEEDAQSDHINPIELLEWFREKYHLQSSQETTSQLIQTFNNRK